MIKCIDGKEHEWKTDEYIQWCDVCHIMVCNDGVKIE